MAASILVGPAGNPSDLVCLSDCVLFTFRNTEFGDGINTINKTLYRLFCVDDNQWLTDPEGEVITTTSSTELISIDFGRLIAGYLETRSPDLGVNEISSPSMKKTICLEVGSSFIDLNNCDNSEIIWEDKSEEYTVVNSYFQNWEDKNTNGFFNTFPLFKPICRDSRDYYYACFNQGTNIRIEGKLTNGSSGFAILNNSNSQGNVSIVDIGPEAISKLNWVFISSGPGAPGPIDVNDLAGYTISYEGQTVNYVVKDCCCSLDQRIDLYFLDPRGGYSLMPTTCIESMEVSRSGIEICRTPGCFTDERDALRNFGTQYLTKDRMVRATLQIKVLIDKTNIRFYQAFAASGKFLASHFCPDGTQADQLEGFIIETLRMPVLTEDEVTVITITGYYSVGYKAH